jgi:hypothetical protein
MYNILFIGRVSVFVMPCLFWARQMFITLQPKKFSMTLTKDLCEKKVQKLMNFEE